MIIQQRFPSWQRRRVQILSCLVSGESATDLHRREGSYNRVLIKAARLLKHLAAMGTIYEVDAGKYLPTPLSEALAVPMYSDGILYAYVSCFISTRWSMPDC